MAVVWGDWLNNGLTGLRGVYLSEHCVEQIASEEFEHGSQLQKYQRFFSYAAGMALMAGIAKFSERVESRIGA